MRTLEEPKSIQTLRGKENIPCGLCRFLGRISKSTHAARTPAGWIFSCASCTKEYETSGLIGDDLRPLNAQFFDDLEIDDAEKRLGKVP
jgi:hypothetical protein